MDYQGCRESTPCHCFTKVRPIAERLAALIQEPLGREENRWCTEKRGSGKKSAKRKVFKKCQNEDVKFINIKSGNEICQLFDSLKCAIDRVIFETHPLTSRWCFQVASGSSMQSGFRAFRRVAPWRYGKKHVDVSHKQKWWGHLEWKPLNNQPPYRPYITWVCVGYIPFKRAPWRLGGLNS